MSARAHKQQNESKDRPLIQLAFSSFASFIEATSATEEVQVTAKGIVDLMVSALTVVITTYSLRGNTQSKT